MNPNKKLLWSQEFDSQLLGSLDSAIWNIDLGDGSHIGLTGWGNNEREFYTEDAISVHGYLRISAQREPVNSSIQTYYGPAEWTSGKIHTANKVGFKYGVLEIHATLPVGQGTWPALWLLGSSLLKGIAWPQCGEIDILEGTGAHPSQIQGTIHAPNYCGENGLTKIIQSPTSLSEHPHTYSIAWSEDRIEWFFDGASYNVIERSDERLLGKDWPFNEEFYLIINLAIGGWFAGDVDPSLQFAELSIHSIKHYALDGVGEVFTY